MSRYFLPIAPFGYIRSLNMDFEPSIVTKITLISVGIYVYNLF